jgi:hypothetical protein
MSHFTIDEQVVNTATHEKYWLIHTEIQNMMATTKYVPNLGMNAYIELLKRIFSIMNNKTIQLELLVQHGRYNQILNCLKEFVAIYTNITSGGSKIPDALYTDCLKKLYSIIDYDRD